MNYITLFLCVGVFLSCAVRVTAYNCVLDGAQCFNKYTDVDTSNPTLMCKNIKATITCLDTALSKCTDEPGQVGLTAGKSAREMQFSTYCKNVGCSNSDLANCFSSSSNYDQNVTLDGENCKAVIVEYECFKELADRCPGLKFRIDLILTADMDDYRACKKLMEGSKPLTDKKSIVYKTDVTNISTTLDQSQESTDLPIFMVITIVLGVVATGFTISTIVACHKYYSSTRSIKLKVSNYDQLDVRRMDQVTYQRAQGVGLPGAQPSGKQSIPRDYLDVVHHLYETAKESATEASPYAEIGEMNPGESPKSSP